MHTLPDSELSTPPARPRPAASRSVGLLVASIHTDDAIAAGASIVGELDPATLRRIRQDALALRARSGRPVTIDARFVATREAVRLIGTLVDLEGHDIRVAANPIAPRDDDTAELTPATVERLIDAPADAPPFVAGAAFRSPAIAVSASAAVEVDRAIAAPVDVGDVEIRVDVRDADPRTPPAAPSSPDPFGLDPELRRAWFAPLRLVFDHYWRVEVSGWEHVPDAGPALIAANHAGAVPADAFMLAVALEVRRPPRALRVLYDRFVDALPVIGPLYRRLGAVSASLANAELLLARGELVGLFPEGIAGVEKRCTERYQLRPFKSGTARLAVRSGAPIIPVSIVGSEEAYPVVARLYRAGRLIGVPWIPITPTFPLCGLAGAVPLPTKWHMQFGPPIFPPPPSDGRPEEARIAETTERLRTAIATGVAGLLAKRRGIFV
jgi:1-acyl-sn-glycerol-3-phosphate acyltransferase